MRSKGELGVRAMYTRYKEVVPEPVDQDTYLQVIECFNKKLAKILLDGQLIKMPFNLGELVIYKKKVNFDKLKLDYGHWRKTGGEKIYHTNRHSDGYHAYYHWGKSLCHITHKSLYKFSPCRQNSRTLAAHMKTPGGHASYAAYLRKTDIAL